jgi:hypothetical protein
MKKLSARGTELRTAAETQNGADKNPCETDNKNQIKTQFISSQPFHRTPGGCIQKITARKQFKPRILESFDPVIQKHNRVHERQHKRGQQQLETRW